MDSPLYQSVSGGGATEPLVRGVEKPYNKRTKMATSYETCPAASSSWIDPYL